jgi:hypothetical protein
METAEEAIRYVLSLPIATLVIGIDSTQVLRQTLPLPRRSSPWRQPSEKRFATA